MEALKVPPKSGDGWDGKISPKVMFISSLQTCPLTLEVFSTINPTRWSHELPCWFTVLGMPCSREKPTVRPLKMMVGRQLVPFEMVFFGGQVNFRGGKNQWVVFPWFFIPVIQSKRRYPLTLFSLLRWVRFIAFTIRRCGYDRHTARLENKKPSTSTGNHGQMGHPQQKWILIRYLTPTPSFCSSCFLTSSFTQGPLFPHQKSNMLF